MLPSSLMLLNTAHEYLGRRSWCCNSDGALLRFYVSVTFLARAGGAGGMIRHPEACVASPLYWGPLCFFDFVCDSSRVARKSAPGFLMHLRFRASGPGLDLQVDLKSLIINACVSCVSSIGPGPSW